MKLESDEALTIRLSHLSLIRKCDKELLDFRRKYNPPGVRYYECYGDNHARMWVSTLEGQPLVLPPGWDAVCISHMEFVARERDWLRDQARIEEQRRREEEDDEL